tara:strand:+ start:490 stop:1197 length:708 start_codon:yes stop_codon:yes gene_type:complete
MLKNKELISNNEGKPEVIQLFSKDEIQKFTDLYDTLPVTRNNKLQKVIKKRWLQNYNKELDSFYSEKLKSVLGDFKMDNLKDEDGLDIFGLFQESHLPLKLHVDSGFYDDNVIYKQTLVPLTPHGETIIYKNRWYGRSTNFTIDEKELSNKSEKIIGKNVVSDLHNKMFGNKIFNKEHHNNYLRHENIDNLKGLEVEKIYKWKIGEILIFDRTHLHSSSCNITSKKLGLTTFTKK